MGSAEETTVKCAKSERDTEFKNELRKGNYVVRTPAARASWVVALWIGWEIQSEGIHINPSSSKRGPRLKAGTKIRTVEAGWKRFGSSFHMWDKGMS